ncbi:MAG: DUF933 domain-containing protein [Candidatus Omnitrophota bacterium]
MKVAVFSLEDFPLGKMSFSDERLAHLKEIFKSKKATPLQIDFVPIDEVKDAEVVLSKEEKKTDLVLTDLEYVQDRLTKDVPQEEKALFTKAKDVLEKEDFLSKYLNIEELKILKGFPLLTILPVYLIKDDINFDLSPEILKEIYYASGRIYFFTGGERESRMWSIRNGVTALEAAGCIHSDIQRGFIRAEVVSADDIVKAGHYNQVKNEGKVRLEEKDYVVQDGDYILFRANK